MHHKCYTVTLIKGYREYVISEGKILAVFFPEFLRGFTIHKI